MPDMVKKQMDAIQGGISSLNSAYEGIMGIFVKHESRLNDIECRIRHLDTIRYSSFDRWITKWKYASRMFITESIRAGWYILAALFLVSGWKWPYPIFDLQFVGVLLVLVGLAITIYHNVSKWEEGICR